MNEIILEYNRIDIEKAFDLHYSKQFPIRSKLLLVLGFFLILGSLALLFSKSAYAVNLKWIFAALGLFYIGFYFFRKKNHGKSCDEKPYYKEYEKGGSF